MKCTNQNLWRWLIMKVLSKPDAGWTDFCLGGQQYGLSYLTCVPLEWLDQAIHGLESMSPFVVHGFCELWRFLCFVSYWNCYIIYEDDERENLVTEDTNWEFVHVNMLEFCKMLFIDISSEIESWCDWGPHFADPEEEVKQVKNDMKAKIQTRLNRLAVLIRESEEHFGENRCFF